MKKTDSKTKARVSRRAAPHCSALANALARIADDLVAVGLGPVNLGALAKHMLKLKPNAEVSRERPTRVG